MTFDLIFDTPIPSKKNAQVEGTAKSGKRYRYYRRDVQKALNDLEMQVPVYVRGLMLEHPKVEVFMTVPHDRADIDGMWTALVDVLKKQRVIRDDNLRYFNGGVYLAPAVIADYWQTVIKIEASPTIGLQEKE